MPPALKSNDGLIYVAPAPAFPRLEGLDDGVVRGVVVLGGVSVGRIVAAADMAARPAEPQVDPSVAALEAFLAALGRPRLNVLYLVEMSAGGHGCSVGATAKSRIYVMAAHAQLSSMR